MKRIYKIHKRYCLFFFLLPLVIFYSCSKQDAITVLSPAKQIEVDVRLDEQGQALWQLSVKKENRSRVVLNPSKLGLDYGDETFNNNLTIKNISAPVEVKDNYSFLSGKTSLVDVTGTSFTVTLANENKKELLVHFRVYDDGAAFQYEIPGTGKVRITEEHSSFAVPSGNDHRAWLLPYEKVTPWAPSYEEYFYEVPVGTSSPEEYIGWCFPMLFNVNSHWMLISEAGQEAFYYGGTQIAPDCTDGIYKIRFSQPEEAQGVFSEFPEYNSPADEYYPEYPELELPAKTNWRTVIAGDKQTVMASNMVQTLNPPSPFADTGWITPGIVAWSWWSVSESPQDYYLMLPHIDMASTLNWKYFLVDANWNLMKNGDIGKLVEYARSKNVELFLWYNSGGPHNVSTELPRDIMNDPQKRKKEMAWLQETGIKGIKVDFFMSDKPAIMQLYKDILEDAMQYEILVNFHGSTLPKGWERTYPNLMTMEAVKGAECYKFDRLFPERAPAHNTILAFSRNVVGAMDYTPTTFTNSTYPHLTTSAHELALSVLFESGIVHIADAVEGIMSAPGYVHDFFRRLPAVWDEIKYLYGEPGREAVIARRKGNDWYIAGINGEKISKEINIDLSFLPENSIVELITDGDDKGFKRDELNAAQSITIPMTAYGGFVITAEFSK